MKYQTAQLTGGLLDAAIAKAKLLPYRIERFGHSIDNSQFEVCWIEGLELKFTPSSSWQVGGPIIEQNRIAIDLSGDAWCATVGSDYVGLAEGSTALIAAMRAFAVAKLGDEVEL